MKLITELCPERIICLRELTLISIFFRFLLAALCGSVIGVERGRKAHAAGLRTHIVVCIGAAAVMIVNQYIITFLNPNADPARMGAQVISGIGFLGVGTIVVTGHQRGQQVLGLTTAAGLWASACMGLAIGIGFYEAAVVMCGFLFLVIVILNHLDARYLKTNAMLRVYVEYEMHRTPLSAIICALRKADWHITHIEYLSRDDHIGVGVLMDLQRKVILYPRVSDDGMEPIDVIRNVEGVLYAEDV